jgi:hypothetical protein
MVELAELLDIPPARGRRSTLVVSKRRNMVASDIASLSTGKPLEQVTPIAQLRHQHHLLARLIAEGKQLTEAAEITGYSVTYISRLKTQDKAFQELIEYYSEQTEEIYISVHERLKGLGLNTIEELQERLALDPEGFSNRELMELATLTMDRSGFGPTHNIKATHTVLTPDMILALKESIQRKQSGTIREISSGSSRTITGTIIDESATSGDNALRVEAEGNSLPANGRKVS